ncbi:hypothetical protein C0993_012438, partial [Termitomyces sp. T159_Od127]
MPTETSKPKKGKQGIKDLGSKDGRLLLTALQNGELKIIKSDIEKIKKDKIAIIATAEPTTNDAPTVHSRAVFASGKTWVGPAAPKSAANTRIKRKKHVSIKVQSDDEQKSTDDEQKSNLRPPSKVPQQQPPKPVYTISSDSEDLPLAPMAKRPLPKKRVVNVSTDSNPNDLSPAQERNPSNAATVSATRKTPSPPSPTAKRQFSKKRMVIIASDNDGNEVSSDTKKRRRFSPPAASEDQVGSGDDYVNEQDEESESGVVLTLQTRRTRHAKSKGKASLNSAKPGPRANATKTVEPTSTTLAATPAIAALPPPPKSTIATGQSTSSSKLQSITKPTGAPPSASATMEAQRQPATTTSTIVNEPHIRIGAPGS